MGVDVTCIVSTKNRYFSTLPHTILAVCQQTYKPKKFIIFDDGEHRDLQKDVLYSHLFSLISYYGINWEVVFASGRGQVHNHIASIKKAETEWIWRLDDDNVPEHDVLEKLIKNIDVTVGAIGGLVITSNSIRQLPYNASNKIGDIYTGINEQWFLHPNTKPKEVDHLYSSFIYRKSLAEYCADLSPVGHREETMMTYGIKLKGFKNILDPSAKTWHFRNPDGGIRSYNDQNHYAHDERIFSLKLAEWNVKPTDYAYVVLDNGLGDHYAFKKVLPEYLQKNKDKKLIIFACFPEAFEDIQDIQLASIADAKNSFENIDNYSLYKWLIDNNWKGNLPDAYRGLYNLQKSENKEEIKKGIGDTIIISPYSFNPQHAKSYPYWNELTGMLKRLDYKIVQVGRTGEPILPNISEFWQGLPLKVLAEKISNCLCWISVDNFLQHMCNCMNPIIPGIVIWGISNPNLFGYSYNNNIIKSASYFRPDQFNTWHGVKQNKDVFSSPEVILKEFLKFVE